MNFVCSRAADLKQGAIRAMFDKAATMTDVVSLGIGEPDMPTPAPVCEAGMDALRRGVTHYTPNAGLFSFREAVSRYSSIKNLNYDPASEIIITNGGMGALSLLISVVIEDGDEVLIQDPQWLNYVGQVEYYGGKAVRVPTCAEENFELKASEIEKRITPKTKMLLLNSPNNPTGEVMSRKALEEIAELAKKHHILVVSDEVYNTLVYDGAKAESISSVPGMKDLCVVINSFSKSFAMTGWRIGYAAGPADIIDKMTKAQENLNACANAMGQEAAAFALQHMELSEELRQVFARRRTLILDGLKSIDGITCGTPMGAFYAFPNISSFGLDSKTFCDRLLAEQKVVCVPGSAFGDCGEGFIRLSYANSEENLQKAVERIRAFCKSL